MSENKIWDVWRYGLINSEVCQLTSFQSIPFFPDADDADDTKIFIGMFYVKPKKTCRETHA